MSSGLEKTALILANIGAINWGLHTFGYGLVDLIFNPSGSLAIIGTILYVIIAICGVWALTKVFK